MSANDKQVGGDHYKSRAIQPWDYIAANKLDFFSANVVKYVTRFSQKGGIVDLEKARHYLDKLIELQEEDITDEIEVSQYTTPLEESCPQTH